MVKEAEGTPSALNSLPDRARSLDAELDARLAELDVTGFHEVELEDGRRFRIPAYFEAVVVVLQVLSENAEGTQ